MDNHFELSDTSFEQDFEQGTLAASLFSHEAHLRLAWIHIETYGIDQAIVNICTQLKRFVSIHGAVDRYNTTVTFAAIRAVYHFKLKSESDNFKDFLHEFPRLKNRFKELLGFHYKTDIFRSELAKKIYLPPELQAFD